MVDDCDGPILAGLHTATMIAINQLAHVVEADDPIFMGLLQAASQVQPVQPQREPRDEDDPILAGLHAAAHAQRGQLLGWAGRL